MKQLLKRLVTLALAVMMALSVFPVEVGGGRALAVGAYGKTTADGVRVRKQPSTNAAYWFKIDMNYVCALVDVTTKSGVTWYKVNVEHPDPSSDRTYIGYIHGDYFKLLTDEEAAAYESTGTVTSTPTATPAPDATAAPTAEGTSAPTATPAPSGNIAANAGATGQITNSGVNFRETEGGRSLRKLDRGTVVEIVTIPTVIDENHWYKVRYDGHEGYIMSTFLRVVSTGDPGATAAPEGDYSDYGYVKLILSSANLRLTPGGDVGAQWEKTGEVLEIKGKPVEAKGYIWYPVMYGGELYYVREDTVQLQATPGSSGVTDGSATQAPTQTIVGYVRTTAAGVNLRLQPAGESVMQIKRNVVLPMLAPVKTEGGYGWYYVQTADNVRGYLRGDCVKVCNADGSDVTTGSDPVATQAPTVAYGYVKTIVDKVNLRNKPTGSSQEQIALGVVVPMTGAKITSGKYYWYPVKAASGKVGYLRGDCVKEVNADGTDISAPTAAPENTAGGTTSPTATPAPTTSVSAYGYVQITKTSVNLRKTAGGKVIGTLEKNSVWPLTGSTTSSDNYTWYPVNVNGKTGFVRGDCCTKLSATQQESYLAGNGVPVETPVVQVNYVQTTVDKVHLRAAASKDSESKFNVALGTVMAYKTTASVGGSVWYKVVYSNTEVWVLGSCVKVMTSAEYDQYLAGSPSTTPQVEVVAGYVKTTVSGVNVRQTAGGKVTGSVDKGKVFAYSKTATAKNYTWYYVNTGTGYGWLRADCVMECKSDGSSLGVSTPSTGTETGTEASYTTLRKGSTGTAVKNLVTKLKELGYYTGDITSSYTSAVETAVRKFQTAKGLEVDGVAGSATQHALFGTVPVGSGSNLTMTLYPAEKIDWFTGGIQQLWPKGANFKIYDVKTGIVWWAHRWSGGYHADIEPLTAADTAKLCKMYGVSSADKINYTDHWHRRPSLVTIGTRTFACSLDGVPHNPDGDTIADNAMTGQICLHFTNSKGHDSGVVSDTHQEAIDYAWKNAPNGHK